MDSQELNPWTSPRSLWKKQIHPFTLAYNQITAKMPNLSASLGPRNPRLFLHDPTGHRHRVYGCTVFKVCIAIPLFCTASSTPRRDLQMWIREARAVRPESSTWP